MNRNISQHTLGALGFITAVFGSLTFPAYGGTPSCASAGQTPVTSTYLRTIALTRGIITSNMSTLAQNRNVGRSFQQFVQRSMKFPEENFMPFPSNARKLNGGPPNVRPDFVERVIYVTDTRGYRDLYGSFVEVKATQSPLTLRYYKSQILGELDAVSQRPAAQYYPGAARVLFITTSDTVVPAETIMKGTNLKVGVWQAIVCTNLQPGGLLQVGPATPLNPELYRTGTLFYGQPGVLNDLAKPGGSPAGYEDMDGGLTGP